MAAAGRQEASTQFNALFRYQNIKYYYQNLKEKGHLFENGNIHILDRGDKWFERGVKEGIYVKSEHHSTKEEA